ncbi:MAG: N-6 DNA methylase [Pirellulales bacterium]
MARWNLQSPESWASFLGLVNVPLFGDDRSTRAPAGTHSVLLDGPASSVTFSLGDTKALIGSKDAARWSWSSNVNHALIVDPSSPLIYSVQWDTPTEFRDHRVDNPDDARKLIELLSQDRPEQADSAVHRTIQVFRSLRVLVADMGGTDLDAIRALNVLLTLSDPMSVQTVVQPGITLGDALAFDRKHRDYVATDFSENVMRFPIYDIMEELLEEHRGLRLDPYLLVRHASGALFQEANIELDYAPSRQQSLFVTLHDRPPAATGYSKRDARYTPTSLARFLADEAIKRFKTLNPEVAQIDVLDPACGSGIFLIEAARSASDFSKVHLRGFDNNAESITISQFAVGKSSEANRSAGQEIVVDIREANSLSSETWSKPNIVLMNPPFLSWRMINESLRQVIKETLGSLYVGQSDTALAFLFRAMKELPQGSVLATLVPGPFLDSRAAKRVRDFLANDPGVSVELIGLFRGYKYFTKAAVEPAFLLISRASKVSKLTVVIAESGHEDVAIRAARLQADSVLGDGYEVTRQDAEVLQKPDWTPRPIRGIQQVTIWRAAGLTTVRDLFDVKLGIRPGDKRVFLVSENELRANTVAGERSFFRPIADTIQHGRIIPSGYIFYPYRNGELTLTTEKDLKQSVPWFYHERLLPKKADLAARRSLRQRLWWELVEPRPTWMGVKGSRILSPAFGYSGSFAFDAGRYVVVQGSAWFSRIPRTTREVYLAYVALFNSYEFESLLALLCPQVQGGQYQLYRADVRDVPLPDLATADASVRDALFEAGELIVSERGFDPLQVSEPVCRAYGMTRAEFAETFAPGDSGAVQQVFDELLQHWRE